jgi:hypothetical protein
MRGNRPASTYGLRGGHWKTTLGVACFLPLGLLLVPAAQGAHASKGAESSPHAVNQSGPAHLGVTTAGVRLVGTWVPKAGIEPAHLRAKPFVPAMGARAYRKMKAAAASTPADRVATLRRLGIPANTPLRSPPTVVKNFAGVDETVADNGIVPPDVAGAVGPSQYVETTNIHFDVYSKSSSALLRSISMNSFFRTTLVLGDEQVIYDRLWNRWLVSAAQFNRPTSTATNTMFLGVSTTSSATGPFHIYQVFFSGFPEGIEWDYPHLGLDQDAVIVTADVKYFGGSCVPSFCAMVFGVAKARIYNGLGSVSPVFNLAVTFPVMPPNVLDQTADDFLLGAPPAGGSLSLFRCHDMNLPSSSTCTLQANIPLPFSYSLPPAAPDPPSTVPIDTIDSRFVNMSTEYTSASASSHPVVWNVHAPGIGGLPTPIFYEVDAETNTLVQYGAYFASPTSYDWNTSIAVSPDTEDAFVTWTSDDPVNGIHTQVRVGGRQGGDLPGVMVPGPALTTSVAAYTTGRTNPQRWGDYSQVALDPRPPVGCEAAWFDNEDVVLPPRGGTVWGTQIGMATYCP